MQINNCTCKLKILQTITDMKHEWADGCKARSHGSNQVLIAHTARAGLFIFSFLFSICSTIFSLHVLYLICR